VSETRHTPGPWTNDDGSISAGEGGFAVANVYSSEDFPCLDDCDEARLAEIDVECAANARLIAAAPDIGAALERLLSEPYGCGFCDSGKLRKRVDGGEPFHADDCGYPMASAALVKAGLREGR
jgi:hypothetical protein